MSDEPTPATTVDSDGNPSTSTGDGLLDPGGDRSFLVDAAIGAGVALVLSFVPFSQVIGGAAASYLHRDDGPLIGAAAGAILTLPAGLFLLVAIPFLGFGVFTGDASGGLVLLLFGLVGIVVLGVFNALLGAVGGFVGIKLAEEYPEPPW